MYRDWILHPWMHGLLVVVGLEAIRGGGRARSGRGGCWFARSSFRRQLPSFAQANCPC